MIPLQLGEVAEAVRGSVSAGAATVDRVVTDSREAGPGALFVALRGESADGHDFIDQALADGAAGVLSERDHDAPNVVRVEDTWIAVRLLGHEVRRRVDPDVIAITGSVGKTTTKDLAAAALRADRATVAARGSFNNELGVPLTLLSVEADTRALVVEIGARGIGHIAELAPFVEPDVAIVTAVAEAHLEFFESLEVVARGTGELVEALGADGTAVLNGDDPRVRAMRDRTDADVLTYGRGDVDVRAVDVVLDALARPSFHVDGPFGTAGVRLPLAGEHHVHNALAALTAACSLGADLEVAAAALEHAAVSAWRSEVVTAGGVVVLNDAYNAGVTSTTAALRSLAAFDRPGRRIAVLGYMAELGPTEDDDHRQVGHRVAELGIDRLIVVGRGAPIAEGARAGGLDGDRIDVVDGADQALTLLRSEVRSGDAVLVKASRVGGLERVAAGLLADLDPERAPADHDPEPTA